MYICSVGILYLPFVCVLSSTYRKRLTQTERTANAADHETAGAGHREEKQRETYRRLLLLLGINTSHKYIQHASSLVRSSDSR